MARSISYGVMLIKKSKNPFYSNNVSNIYDSVFLSEDKVIRFYVKKVDIMSTFFVETMSCNLTFHTTESFSLV